MEAVDPLVKAVDPAWESVRLDLGDGTHLHLVKAGPKVAKGTVLLLHGFPEFWYSWRHQMTALANAGFRAIAPDLLGYNLSDKPRGVARYRIERLIEDLVKVVRIVGKGKKVKLVGHDWGGGLAWCLAAWHPALIDRLCIMNAPHPTLMVDGMRDRDQLRRSWYMYAFQIPWLPERLVRRPSTMKSSLRGATVNKEAFTDEDLARYVEAIRRPGAARAAINYYRAAFPHRGSKLPIIEMPTLVVWGDKDPFIGPRLYEGLENHVTNLRWHHVPDASHWVQNERPDEVNRALVSFLQEGAQEVSSQE